mgnify:CR=1 FL=1
MQILKWIVVHMISTVDLISLFLLPHLLEFKEKEKFIVSKKKSSLGCSPELWINEQFFIFSLHFTYVANGSFVLLWLQFFVGLLNFLSFSRNYCKFVWKSFNFNIIRNYHQTNLLTKSITKDYLSILIKI